MKGIFFDKNKVSHVLVLLFLVISIFSIYCVADINKTADMRISKKDEIQFSNLNEHAMSILDNQEKNTLACFHILQENSDNFIHKIYLGSLLEECNFDWLFFQLILLTIFQSFLYIKAWLINVIQNRYDLFLVHLIELKDGKKSALKISVSV